MEKEPVILPANITPGNFIPPGGRVLYLGAPAILVDAEFTGGRCYLFLNTGAAELVRVHHLEVTFLANNNPRFDAGVFN